MFPLMPPQFSHLTYLELKSSSHRNDREVFTLLRLLGLSLSHAYRYVFNQIIAPKLRSLETFGGVDRQYVEEFFSTCACHIEEFNLHTRAWYSHAGDIVSSIHTMRRLCSSGHYAKHGLDPLIKSLLERRSGGALPCPLLEIVLFEEAWNSEKWAPVGSAAENTTPELHDYISLLGSFKQLLQDRRAIQVGKSADTRSRSYASPLRVVRLSIRMESAWETNVAKEVIGLAKELELVGLDIDLGISRQVPKEPINIDTCLTSTPKYPRVGEAIESVLGSRLIRGVPLREVNEVRYALENGVPLDECPRA